ncbi:L-carnitine dehydratase [Limnochorda pilosa]|uniref:L-carnitine dehydratase n=1 Tax=Limnochorda pilosa TaxID=1555112 RepID=A0A0K2SHQ6_LIMPI|nr:L-carnitine dehydratase [Limnochorda pilosa]
MVEVAPNLPGPLAGAVLAADGAEVVRFEPPEGDALARVAPAYYRVIHQAKRILRLDLKEPDGQRSLQRELSRVDVLLTSLRPSTLARLGLASEEVRARHPGLVQVAIVGYPEPDQERSGHDLTYQAAAGTLEAGGEPSQPRVLVADYGGALAAVAACYRLLLARERSGRGGYQEIALSQAGAFFAQALAAGLTAPGGVLGGGIAAYHLYPCQDGWIALAALERRSWGRFCLAEGLEELEPLGHRPVAQVPHVRERLAERFRARTAAEWAERAARLDLPLEPVAPRPGGPASTFA